MDNSIIIGGITGVISQGLTWPMEYLKTKKQLPQYSNSSVFKILSSDVKANGLLSVYRGLSPQLVSAFPRAAVRFAVYENLKNRLEDENGNLSNGKKFICGLVAGGVEAATVMTPAEVIKIQTINKNINLQNTLKNVYQTNGILGFYKGIVPTTIRQATTQGTSFLVYDKTKLYYDKINYIGSYSGLLAGMTGGTIAVLVNNPVDAIKTYKQSDRGNNSIISISNEIIKKHGFKGFYKGALLRISRVAPLHGFTFFTYDWLKEKLN